MFSKKPHSDVKKSSQKVLDFKKDSLSRLKHLKNVLENSDFTEAKSFFQNNYSHIYYIFYDAFIGVENNLKQRAHYRTHREELDVVKFILEKLLILLPELLHKRWQCHSLGRIMKKFLHCGNSIKLRKEGISLFLLWYQVLGDNAPTELDNIFASLVPGLVPSIPNPYLAMQSTNQGHGFFNRVQAATPGADTYQDNSTFYASTPVESPDTGPVYPSEVSPIVPMISGEHQPDDHTKYFLDCLLDFMVSQAGRIEWQDKGELRSQRCFNFLFEKFKKYYLPYLFPTFSSSTNVYAPTLDLPELRYENDLKSLHDSIRFAHRDTLFHCQAIFVRWLTHFTQCLKKSLVTFQPQQQVINEMPEHNDVNRPVVSSEGEGSQSSTSFLSATSVTLDRDPSNTSLNNDELSYRDYLVVQDTLYSSRENINFVHEIFRQAFLMHFTYSSTMRRVVAVYREWIQKNNTEKPLFLDEPTTRSECDNKDGTESASQGSILSATNSVTEVIESTDLLSQEQLGLRLRKDSYLKAIHSDYGHLKAGLQKILNVFITNAANVFLLNISPDNLKLLDEQVDMCKRVLNIYRYMVMNVQMDRKVWEQLLLILLQITSLVLREIPPVRKEDTLGGRLAPALFQTLIVTWIKANLNVVVSTELWDQYLQVLSSLTQWEELVKEWAKTMETLTRVLAKQVYCLDLNDLPLDRLSEQKLKKTRGMKKMSMGSMEEKSKMQSTDVAGDYSNRHDNVINNHSNDVVDRGASHLSIRCRSGSGSCHSKRGLLLEQACVRRCVSDSNIYMKECALPVFSCCGDGPKVTSVVAKCALPVFSSSGDGPKVTSVITKRLDSSNTGADDYSRLIPLFGEEYEDQRIKRRLYTRQKSKSLDFILPRADSPSFSESSECQSRSPSPTPSSGLESTSIKESPMQIDVLVSHTDNCDINSSDHGEARSVMSGGTTRGWLSDVAIVLWKRMLGALGNINFIKEPFIHAQILKYLVDLSDLLIKIRDNLSVTVDNQTSPPPPELVPPSLLITPWLFEAITLPYQYKQGKLLAYELLCKLSLCHHDIPLSKDYLVQFYQVLHHGLIGDDQDIMNVIVRACGPKIFSSHLPGSTLLSMDFIYAADTIVSSTALAIPRTEAMSILGALLYLPVVCKNIPTLHTSTELNTEISQNIKDHITSILFRAGRREPTSLARCIAVNSVGIYLYSEFQNKTYHYKIKEAVSVLLLAVRFNCKPVAQVASDMLMMLSDHAKQVLKMYPDLIKKIIDVLSSTLGSLLPNPNIPVDEEDKKLMLSLMHCLGEWCMCINDPDFLVQEHFHPMTSLSPLYLVLKVLIAAARGSTNSSIHSQKFLSDPAAVDVDPNVVLDNMQEGTSSPSLPSKVQIVPQKTHEGIDNSSFFKSYVDSHHNHDVIKLAAKNVLQHLVNHIGHFPMGIGAVRITSLVNEYDDVPSLAEDELSAEVFHAPNIQIFAVNNHSIVSFVEIPIIKIPGGGATAGLSTSPSQVRVIVRDLSGKYSWDSSILYGPPDYNAKSSVINFDKVPVKIPVHPSSLSSSTLSLSGAESSISEGTLRHRPSNILPTVDNSADDLDNLDDLLQYIGYSGPECIPNPGQTLNVPPKLPSEKAKEMEMSMMNLILNQRNQEHGLLNKYTRNSSMESKSIFPPEPCEVFSPFQHCRLFLNQLGFTSWEKRSSCDLLKKNEQLLRELRNLDKQKCRETHKIAVIYVAQGQEDKISILSNTSGSQEYEEFIAGLGWEVELENHLGFLGGLQSSKNSDTAPYYATSFIEVIFHVSTRMSVEKDALNKKVRHLGNDEVHIVWSEHIRDYRKEIIATEFCDVLIVIYPLGGRLYRIHISRKPGVPFFGPLFNGAIVEHKVLAILVRNTAINANRAKRSLVSMYMNYFEERARSLEVIMKNHKERTTFEQFASDVYSPTSSKFSVPSRSSGPPSRADSACSHMPNLAAALLDAHGKGSGYSPTLRSRPVSQSTTEGMSPRGSPLPSLRDRPLSASNSST